MLERGAGGVDVAELFRLNDRFQRKSVQRYSGARPDMGRALERENAQWLRLFQLIHAFTQRGDLGFQEADTPPKSGDKPADSGEKSG